ncbi:hypothetical protein G7Y79_00001g000250 [Physcia stellaris]|nr:hypothetical protein G7Y79_00001g000250 [Physcia stellaris]
MIKDEESGIMALAQYDERIRSYATYLEEHIAKSAKQGHSVDVTAWFYWFSFDVMGDFAFAKSFDMLRDEKWHHVVLLLRRAMSLLGPLSPVPWLAQIGFSLIPGDTVAPTLVFLFYELARHPAHADKLHAELAGIDLTNSQALQDLPHLNGIINETLRIHPPVPSGGYRETPPQGLTIADTYIPGGTTIVAPRFTIGRLESCFEDAEQFVPERWYSRPEMVRNRKAFAPFSQGRYSCVGKNLALSELRYVAALLVGRYHVGFAPGESGGGCGGEDERSVYGRAGRVEACFHEEGGLEEGHDLYFRLA